jgi:ATP-binding protein involved in chromosome partitioning
VRDAALSVEGVEAVEVRFEPSLPDFGARVDFIPEVSNVIAVGSGKGGVGKSTVAVNFAAALAATGANVGLVDADVYGPNTPSMLGLESHTPETTLDDRMIPREAHGLKVMSMGFIVDDDDPVIWRGPLVDEFLKQLFDDVAWDDLDCLVVDMPPGTGDAQLSLVQHLPVSGALIVTTPESVAIDDARRGLQGFANYDVPILGVVENMSRFECPDCGTEHTPFGDGGADSLEEEFNVPVVGRLPLDPAVGSLRTEDGDDDDAPGGVSLPLLGRLQLPRTRAERERPDSHPPVAVREGGGEPREAFELLAARVAARLGSLDADRPD